MSVFTFAKTAPLTKVEELSKTCFEGDREDMQKAVELFRADDHETLADHIAHMDTEPREELVCAFGKDLGNGWVAQVLGWEIQ